LSDRNHFALCLSTASIAENLPELFAEFRVLLTVAPTSIGFPDLAAGGQLITQGWWVMIRQRCF
jgi:hypothetical protein